MNPEFFRAPRASEAAHIFVFRGRGEGRGQSFIDGIGTPNTTFGHLIYFDFLGKSFLAGLCPFAASPQAGAPPVRSGARVGVSAKSRRRLGLGEAGMGPKRANRDFTPIVSAASAELPPRQGPGSPVELFQWQPAFWKRLVADQELWGFSKTRSPHEEKKKDKKP